MDVADHVDVLRGRHRFDELVESIGITRSVLSRRLNHLVAQGVLERRLYQRGLDRFAHHATEKGWELFVIVALLMQWGDRYYPHPTGPPRLLLHRDCGGWIALAVSCARCGASPRLEDVEARLGPVLAPSCPIARSAELTGIATSLG